MKKLLLLYIWWTLVFALQKPLFMLCYRGLYEADGLRGLCVVVWHGLPLDLSMAGYLCSLPAVLLLAAVWSGKRLRSLFRSTMKWWIFAASAVVSLTFLLNVVLYEYWQFPLDSMPVFYFFSSPKDAVASVSGWMLLLGVVLWCGLTILLYTGACWVVGAYDSFSKKPCSVKSRWLSTAALLAAAPLLFVLIRGGVTVASMNTGRVYFSEKPALNHAAVNPLFSLMESLAHEEDFDSQYRMMDDAEATALFDEMVQKSSSKSSRIALLNTTRPDIYLIILESFSSKLMGTLGGNGVAACLDSLADESVLFCRFYANSFRTDRGLVSILSGYPAQPTMSLMKFPRKTASLPSIVRSLAQVGYATHYYYGGDADFTNMRSYLVSQGFEHIVSDADFSVKDRLSKWGVPDHLVFERLLTDMRRNDLKQPTFYVVQTSSSHEPFDVPYKKLNDERLNAFSYTDSCVGHFVRTLRSSARWKKSLVVLVPDHQGAWPQGLSNFEFARYEIPLMMTGGAVASARRVETLGCQQDIAATLLSQLELPHDNFLYSKDLMNESSPHFAFFTVSDAFGIVTDDARLIFDNKSGKVLVSDGEMAEKRLREGQAYLQKLYDDIQNR